MYQIPINFHFLQTYEDFILPCVWNFRGRFVCTSESLLLSRVEGYSDPYRLALIRVLTLQSEFNSTSFCIF